MGVESQIPKDLLGFATAVTASTNTLKRKSDSTSREGCAILFYGLPRAFGELVLPSIEKNVIQTNAQYSCDFFVHYFNVSSEAAGRSGGGGHINVDDIFLLQKAVAEAQGASSNLSQKQSITLFTHDTNETFYRSHDEILQEVLNAKDETGARPLYYPWMEKDYVFPDTTLNILKMWHSIDRAFHLMDHYGHMNDIRYTRIAMLRSDVVFLTPIDIWDTGVPNVMDKDNGYVVIPSFARYPVSDRAIYGTADGVRTWATTRFEKLLSHVQEYRGSGYVLHHEHFVESSLLRAIRENGIHVMEHPTLCFCRARANQRVWFNDCIKGNASPLLKRKFPDEETMVQAVELATSRKCQDIAKESISQAMSVLCS